VLAGPEGDEFHDGETGREIDVAYWDPNWLADRIDAVTFRHEASLGGSTCLWFTAARMQPLHDPRGWLAGLQARAGVPYPERLRERVVRRNTAVLRASQSSYRRQLEKALRRGDPVSVNHRTAALVASAFDVVFAANRELHPGEKRLLEIVESRGLRVPEAFAARVAAVIAAAGTSGGVLEAVDELASAVEAFAAAELGESAAPIRAGLPGPAAPESAAPESAAPAGDVPTTAGPGAAGGEDGVPVVSRLLARSAAIAASDDAALTRETRFGWVARLEAGQVVALGRALEAMLEAGAPPNAGRGFGIAWSESVSLPSGEYRRLFDEFVELAHAVAEALAGRELADPRLASGRRRGLLGGLFGGRSGSSEADAVLEGAGPPAMRGLVAAWNAWMAMRYRDRLAPEVLELLTRPWLTAVGPLPPP
jgi:hypothetical protein